MENHTNFRNLKMKNIQRPLKMSYTPYFKCVDTINRQSKIANEDFDAVYEFAQNYNSKSRKEFLDSNLQKEINRVKADALSHCKRLAKKRNEEVERGSHEYANYIVSMIHSSAIYE